MMPEKDPGVPAAPTWPTLPPGLAPHVPLPGLDQRTAQEAGRYVWDAAALSRYSPLYHPTATHPG